MTIVVEPPRCRSRAQRSTRARSGRSGDRRARAARDAAPNGRRSSSPGARAARRPRELEALAPAVGARDFRGTVVVHDCDERRAASRSSSTARDAGARHPRARRDRPRRLRDGGRDRPSTAAPARSSAPAPRRTIASRRRRPSLLEPRSRRPACSRAGSQRALARRSAVVGVSIVLDHPRLTGRYRGYPSSTRRARRLARSPLRRLSQRAAGLAPRRGAARSSRASSPPSRSSPARPPSRMPRRCCAAIALARRSGSTAPLDTIVVAAPVGARRTSRASRSNPITAAAIAASASRCGSGGTRPRSRGRHGRPAAPISRRTFGHGRRRPYRALFHVLREGADRGRARRRPSGCGGGRAARARRVPARARTASAAPFADWASCAPALDARRGG